MTIRFNEDDVRPMGRTAAGVRGMKLRADDEVVSVDVGRDDTAILMVTEAGYGKRTQLDHYNAQGRGGQGVIGIKLTGKKGEVVAAFMVGIDDEIVAVSTSGVTIRMPVREISSQGRGATGVRVMNLDAGRPRRIGGRHPRQRRVDRAAADRPSRIGRTQPARRPAPPSPHAVHRAARREEAAMPRRGGDDGQALPFGLRAGRAGRRADAWGSGRWPATSSTPAGPGRRPTPPRWPG